MPIATTVNRVSVLQNANNIQPDALRQTYSISTLSAAGTTQATAAVIGVERPFVLIDNNTAANGVVLPTAGFIGQEISIYPQLITNAPLVYPPVGGTINNAAVNAGVATPARKAVKYIAIDRTGLNYVTVGL